VRYGRKPIWTDEGVWYPEACRMLRLEHHVYPVQWKNLMERINRPLKDKLENFDDLFQCLKEGVRPEPFDALAQPVRRPPLRQEEIHHQVPEPNHVPRRR